MMVEMPLPNHVVAQRRDGRREVLLHRSMAVIGPDKIEIRSARSTVLLPVTGLALAGGAIAWLALNDGAAPLWALSLVVFVCLFVVPASVMGLVSAIAGADAIVDGRKGSVTWQQGYLGMGIGTKELVPFEKIDYLEISVEGEEGDRWRGASDDVRQFALTIVKKSGKRLQLAQVPVPVSGQADGMDRTLAVGNAVAALTGSTVRIPYGWALVEIDTETGEVVEPRRPGRQKPRRRR